MQRSLLALAVVALSLATAPAYAAKSHLAITSGPSGLVNTRSATIDFTIARKLSAIVDTHCILDGVDGPCALVRARRSVLGSAGYSGLEDGVHTFTVREVPVKGHAETASLTWTVDATPPSLSPSVTPDPVALNGAATASANASDAGSGIASSSCDAVDTATAGDFSVICRATDNAGNSASAQASYTVAAPPELTAVATLPGGTDYVAGTWTNLPVTVAFECTADPSLPPPDVSPPQTLGSEGGGQTASGSCTDALGQSAQTTFGPIDIDLTAPTLDPSVTPDPVPYNGSGTADPNASDAGGSGLASASCDPVVASGPITLGAPQTVSCTASDVAGNTATGSATYTVADVPAAPAIGTAADAGNGQASVAWTPPDDRGSPITGYTIHVQPGGATRSVDPTACSGDACGVTVGSLTACTGYTFSVDATNVIGTGAASDASNSVTPVGTPDAPTGLQTTRLAAGISASWSAPASGCSVDGYRVDVHLHATGALVQSAPTTATSLQLSNLPACPYPSVSCDAADEQTYDVSVLAHDAAGYGPAVSTSSPVRPFVSYTQDNVVGIWSAGLGGGTCQSCHFSGPGPVLTGSPAQSLTSILSTVSPLSEIYTCPSLTGACGALPSHPGGQGFTSASKEYELLAQWVADGARG